LASLFFIVSFGEGEKNPRLQTKTLVGYCADNEGTISAKCLLVLAIF